MATPTSLPATFVAGNVLTAAEMNGLRGAFRIVAVKHALFTGTQTNSTAAGSNFSVTDLSITHTLTDSANKLIISAYIGLLGGSFEVGEVGLAIADGGTFIGVGDADGARTRLAAGGKLTASGDVVVTNSLSVMFVYAPGDTASHTYTVEAVNHAGSTQTVYVNRTKSDTDSVSRPRGSSGLVIQEVSA